MERLTYLDGGKWRLRLGDTEYSGPSVNRFAAYEDTGLEPEAFQVAMQEFSNHLMEHTQYRDTGTVKEFRALKEAEQKRQEGCVRCESPCQTCMIGCFKQEPDTCGGYTLPPMQYFCKTCGRDLRGESHE